MAVKQPMEAHEVKALLASLKAKGRDPATATSCAPGEGEEFRPPGVHGCPHYYGCIFGQKRFGGFKGSGRDYLPHNVIYEFKPNDGTNHQKEDIVSCHAFMQTRAREMFAGRTAMEQNEPGELINIIGGEGDEYLFGWFGKDPKWPNQNDPNVPFLDQVETRTCPPYKPMIRGHRDDSYEAQVEKRRAERQSGADDPHDTPLPKRRLSPNDPAPKTAKELEAKLAEPK